MSGDREQSVEPSGGSRDGSPSFSEDSEYSGSPQKDHPFVTSILYPENRKREKSTSSTPFRQRAELGPFRNRVIDGLAALEDRFMNPRCSQCSRVARIDIYTVGPVIVCTDMNCKKVERVDTRTLQLLVESLRVTCRKCNTSSMISIRGPLGCFLKCRDCGENTSWQFVAGYSGKN